MSDAFAIWNDALVGAPPGNVPPAPKATDAERIFQEAAIGRRWQPPVEQSEESLRRSVLEGSDPAPWYAYPGEVIAGVPRGAIRTTGMFVEGVGRIARDVSGLDPDVEGIAKSFIEAGQSVQQAAERALPVAPDMEGGITQAISEGVGSVIPAAAAFATGGLVGIGVFGASTGYAGTYDQTLELSKAAGLNDDEARDIAKKYARVSALVTGATEPFGAAARGVKILKRLDDATGKWLGKEILKAASGEALQEGLQEIPDEVARKAYIKERTLFDSIEAVGGAAAIGGTVGVIFGGLASAPAIVRAAKSRAALLANHESRKAAGQKDPTPSKDFLRAQGVPEEIAGGTRKVRAAFIETLKQEKADVAQKPPEEVRAPQGEARAEEVPQAQGEVGDVLGAPGGVAYAPSRPPGGQAVTPSAEPAEATIGPLPEQRQQGAKVTFRPVATPELIELAESIIGQRPKIARRIRKNYGLFKSQEGNPLAAILINPKIAVDPATLAQTLAHELGHAVDFVPQSTLKRGNILGRIASLRGYLTKHLEAYPGAPGPLTEADRARIAEDVRKLKGETVEREIDEEIERTTGLTAADVMAVWNAATDVKVNPQVEAYIKTLNRRQMKQIIAQAIKGIVPEQLRKFANVVREKTGRKIKITEKLVPNLDAEIKKRVQEEIAKRRLFRDVQVREELINLTAWWSGPFNPKSKASYDQYRASSRELYAEAVSVLLRAPSELKARAPEFWRGFTAYLDRKPQVRDELLSLMNRLGGMPEEIAKHRTERIRKMFEDSESQILAVDTALEAARQSVYADIMETLYGLFVDRHIPVRRAAKEVHRVGDTVLIDKAENAIHIMDEMNNLDRDLSNFIKWSDREVLRPLIEAGLTHDDIGEYLMMRRIIAPANEGEGGDRFNVANPLGFDPQAAKEQIGALQSRLGAQKFRALEAGMQKWHAGLFHFAEEAQRVGVISKKTFETTIAPNKDAYATFAVVRHYEGKISGGIRKQLGTFEDIINPFTGTMMKVVSLSRMIRLNEAKQSAVEFLRSLPGERVEEVPILYGEREPTKAPLPGREHLLVMYDGAMKAFSVPQNWARMFKSHDIGSATLIGKILSWPMYRVFHPLWVTFSHGFGVANTLFRDPKRAFVNLPGAVKLHAPDQKITWRQLIISYFRTAPSAWKKAWGIDDAIIRKMEQEGTLKSLWTQLHKRNFGLEETKLARLLSEYGATTTEATETKMRRIVSALWRSAEGLGVFGETWTNAAAVDVMDRAGVPLERKRFIVKKYAGTPDISQRGWANPVTNAMFAYWKVRINGIETDARLATSSKSAADWWVRRTVMTMIPVLATFAATRGLFGEYLRSLFQDIPDSAKQTGSPMPIGRNKQGKAMYFNVIQDDTGRFLHSLAWHTLNGVFPENDPLAGTRLRQSLGDFRSYLIPGLNPVLEMARVWGSYALGVNPYDPFLARRILNGTEEKAGGWPATRKMLFWTMSQFGVASTLAYPILRQVRGQTAEESDESALEIASKAAVGLQRIFKISDRGRTEAYWTAVENEDQEGAQFLTSLPASARQLTARRYLLNRVGLENLKGTDAEERTMLNFWYQNIYEPYTKGIRAAEAAGLTQDADGLRNALDAVNREFLRSNLKKAG